jgi:hypothetical protein
MVDNEDTTKGINTNPRGIPVWRPDASANYTNWLECPYDPDQDYDDYDDDLPHMMDDYDGKWDHLPD